MQSWLYSLKMFRWETKQFGPNLNFLRPQSFNSAAMSTYMHAFQVLTVKFRFVASWVLPCSNLLLSWEMYIHVSAFLYVATLTLKQLNHFCITNKSIHIYHAIECISIILFIHAL